MTHDNDASTSIAEQAASWWEVLHDEDVSIATHREFADWVVSPERVAAYLRVARLHQTLKASAIHWPDTPAAELVRDAKAAPAEVLPLSAFAMSRPGTEHRRPYSRVRLAWGLAAVLIASIGLAWSILLRPQQFQTQFGEQRSVLLEDGSRVTLNTASKIEVHLQAKRRVVRLLKGEALFEVAHDPSRPFDVVAENATLRAVGTQFDVDVRPHGAIITVVEGIVAWMSDTDSVDTSAHRASLIANDRLLISADGTGIAQHGVNAAAATSWIRHQLVFEHRPLGEVVEEFNRYNRDQIKVSSPQLRAQEITGVFQSNDSASFLAFLSSLPGVSIRDDNDGNHIVAYVATQP